MNDQLSKDVYLAAIEADGGAIVAAAGQGVDVAVPSCPGWDIATLAGHMGRVYRWASEIIERRSTEMVASAENEDPPTDESVVRWLEDGHVQILAALDGIEPDEPVWTWTSRQEGGFYHRRMAQETLVHRWDAENALGAVGPIDGDLAADGVTELYEFLVPTVLDGGDKPEPEGSLHLHRTDGAGEWLLRNVDGRLVVTREHAKGDVAVRASGADLLLLGWGRVDLDDVDAEIFGDPALAEAWLGISR